MELLAASRACIFFGLVTVLDAWGVQQVELSEGAWAMIDGRDVLTPTNTTARVTKAWTFLETPPGCAGDISVKKVCVSHSLCEDNIIIGKHCNLLTGEHGIALAEFNVVNGSLRRTDDVYFVNGTVFPILAETRSVLQIHRATPSIAGVYTLHVSIDGMMKHSVVLLTVKKPPKQPQPRLRVKTPPPVTVPQVPVKTHTDFVVHGYHSRVYADGESFELSVNLESHIVEPSFSAEIQWYYMNTSSSSCDLFRVFETCIFHPTAMACLHPEQHTCSFTSPIRATKILHRVYGNCSDHGNSWPSRCHSTLLGNRLYFIQPAQNRVDLLFKDTPASATGLYVFVLLYNGHPEAWTYTLLSTANHFMNVLTDVTRPRLGEHFYTDLGHKIITPHPSVATTEELGAWTRHYLAFLLVIICTCAALLVALVVWGCILYIRSNRKPYEVLNPFETVYTSVPSNDPSDEVLVFERLASDSDDSFDSDSDEELEYPPPPKPAPQLPPYQFVDGGDAPSGRSGFKVWFRDTPEASPVPLHKPTLQGPDYSRVASKLKSILK
ncbi:membrane glycoprotein E [Equid alphaherpesvirus 1]|nr:membrane glycoprotein E [Equid alphaherpesvirus 1]WIM36957.1 membrane glycoprotein E [Equid alphaherpesvirus 1]